jgi:hypothetical protein
MRNNAASLQWKILIYDALAREAVTAKHIKLFRELIKICV